MKFTTVASEDPRTLKFVLHQCPTYTANALRRVLLSELVCPGFPNAYAHNTRKYRTATVGTQSAADVTDTDGSTSDSAGSGVHIRTNTGRLHNEILRHRLSMMPLALNPIHFRSADGRKFVLRLKVSCPADADGPIHVTSDSIQLVKCGERSMDSDEHSKEEQVVDDVQPLLLPGATKLIPTDPNVNKALESSGLSTSEKSVVPTGILITRLYPEESLDIDLYPGVGCSRNFAGYAPLQTCTYEQIDTSKSPLHDFRFTLKTLGAYDCSSLVKMGLDVLMRKVRVFRELLKPNTIELDFGVTAHPSLHTLVSTNTRQCWVKWSDVDFLTRLHAPDMFYQKHCHEVLAASSNGDQPIRTEPYTKGKRIPSVDSEDLIESTDKCRHVLALHQDHFEDVGIYEYVSKDRSFKAVPEAHTTFIIAKEGRTQRAKVFTQAEMVHIHDTRCVLRFASDVPSVVVEHIRSHIDGIICAGLSEDDADKDPVVHLHAPAAIRPNIETIASEDMKCFCVTVPQEDHTLGNLVQGWVYDKYLRTDNNNIHTEHKGNNHGLSAIGYKQPLPSERTILFRVEFDKPFHVKEKEKDIKTRFSGVMGEWLGGVESHLVSMNMQWNTK